MLQSISIKNLALIKTETIDFDKGLNIILGETGAGKSLIFESMFFVLGLKTDKSLIRYGEDNMKVDALFTNLSNSVKVELKNFDIDTSTDELMISRSLNQDGRSSIKINGQIATLNILKTISKNLVDTLVQHESLELLKSKNHLQMVDDFIGIQALSLKQEISGLIDKIRELINRIDELGGDKEERERRKEILEYQISEIEKADVKIGEDEEIEQRLEILNSAEKIKETLSYVLNLLSGDDKGAVSRIQDCARYLGNLSNFEQINNLQERLENSKYEIEDIADELQSIYSNSAFDEIEYQKLDARKDQHKNIKKKYGATLEIVLEFYDKISKQLDEISNSEFIIEKLTKEKEQYENNARQLSVKLSNLRKEKAEVLKSRIVNELEELGMKGTKFEIAFTEKENPTANGIDEVNFNFSANEGQATKKLSKTASGGEMSRIMLAIKNTFTSSDGNRTLLFDEVDAGISGETGNMIAKKLKNISNNEQIICITHLPQVASAGNNYIKVSKYIYDGQTYSNSKIVEGDEIADEIAHLISGKLLTDTAIKNAKELISKFN
jgi:DNA repair protein RecN (Recombination protein N)